MINAYSSASVYTPYPAKPEPEPTLLKAPPAVPPVQRPGDPETKAALGSQKDPSAQAALGTTDADERQFPEKAGTTDGKKPTSTASDQLSSNEELVIAQLQARDRDVRTHEAAHAASGGGHAGTPSYSYTNGPDGRRYATGGSVPIDVSPASNPEDTIAKMSQVRRAALAPRDPSSADRAIAARAGQQLSEAQRELIAVKLAEAYPNQAPQPGTTAGDTNHSDDASIGAEPVSADSAVTDANRHAKTVAEHAATPIRTGISLQA